MNIHSVSKQQIIPDWLILGAGVSGLITGSLLLEQGQSIQILEKSNGVGGRLATRRIAFPDDPKRIAQFDHGLPIIELFHPEVIEILAELLGSPVLDSWQWPEASKWGSTALKVLRPLPGMNAFAKAFPASGSLQNNKKIHQLKYDPSEQLWLASTQEGSTFSGRNIISTLPTPQMLELLDRSPLEFEGGIPEKIRSSQYHPALSVLVIPQDPDKTLRTDARHFQLLRNPSPHIGLAWENQWKGISTTTPCMTLSPTPELAQELFSAPDPEILHRVLKELEAWEKIEVSQFQIHRWRYAQPKDSLGPTSISLTLKNSSPESALHLCGDSFGPSEMSPFERAVLSGAHLAQKQVAKR